MDARKMSIYQVFTFYFFIKSIDFLRLLQVPLDEMSPLLIPEVAVSLRVATAIFRVLAHD